MNTTYEALFRSIRTKCQREHWFGPDASNPAQYDGILEYDPHFDVRSIQQVAADDPNRFGFVFPPATKEQLQLTETLLGLPLPPLLRSLYAQVANGGFGPGGGLKGIVGGYGSVESGTHTFDTETMIDQYRWRSHKRIFDLRVYEQREKRTHLEVPYGEWPRELLPLCNLGCVQEACVDNQERMFLVAPIDSNDVYSLSQLPWTLEEWLWRWIRDEDLVPRYAGAA